jgi:hypothetical protein
MVHSDTDAGFKVGHNVKCVKALQNYLKIGCVYKISVIEETPYGDILTLEGLSPRFSYYSDQFEVSQETSISAKNFIRNWISFDWVGRQFDTKLYDETFRKNTTWAFRGKESEAKAFLDIWWVAWKRRSPEGPFRPVCWSHRGHGWRFQRDHFGAIG